MVIVRICQRLGLEESKCHSYSQQWQEGRFRELELVSLTSVSGKVIKQMNPETVFIHEGQEGDQEERVIMDLHKVKHA